MKKDNTHNIERFDIQQDTDAVKMVDFIFEMLSDGYSVQVKNDTETGLIYVDPYKWSRVE